MNRIIAKEYISFLDFLNKWYEGIGEVKNDFGAITGLVKNSVWSYQSLYEFLTQDETLNIDDILSQFHFIEEESGVYSSSLVVDDLWDRIRQRFQNNLIVYPIDVNNEYMNLWINNFISILVNTYDKYSLIISKWVDLRDNILEGVTTSVDEDGSVDSSQRFNDTPQTYDEDGETLLDNDYTSNVSLGKATNNRNVISIDDREFLVDRLQRVEDKLEDIYLSWSNEFNKLFK